MENKFEHYAGLIGDSLEKALLRFKFNKTQEGKDIFSHFHNTFITLGDDLKQILSYFQEVKNFYLAHEGILHPIVEEIGNLLPASLKNEVAAAEEFYKVGNKLVKTI